MQSQISKILKEIRNNYKNNLTFIKNKKEMKKKDLLKILKNNIIKETIKKVFTLNTLSQLLDETNSLAEISHKRKITCLGEGGISIKKANLKIREIHPSQYGKICPIETTEGKNAGLILSFANEIKVTNKGFLETPFFLRIKQ